MLRPPSVWPTRTGPNGSAASPRPSPPLTHVDGRCRTAVTAVTLCVAVWVRGRRAPNAARAALSAVADLEGGEELELLVEAVGGSRAIDGPDQGFCLFTAGTAFQALVRPGDAETELRRVVSSAATPTPTPPSPGSARRRDGVRGLPPAWLERLLGADAVA